MARFGLGGLLLGVLPASGVTPKEIKLDIGNYDAWVAPWFTSHSLDKTHMASAPFRPHTRQREGTVMSARKPGPLETLIQVYTQNAGPREGTNRDRKYTLITGLPLQPYFERPTYRTQVDSDIWVFEQVSSSVIGPAASMITSSSRRCMYVLYLNSSQPQGFFNVTTTVRMTVVKLKSTGGLWVHAPIAPTRECVRLLDEVGRVDYIVLPTTALEHKVYVKDFSKAYPKAKVYACPGQWSYPINLKPSFRIDGELGDGDETAPWFNEIEQALFRPPVIGIGPANEVVFFHKRTSTLVSTDLIVYIDPDYQPSVVTVPDLLKAARETEDEPIPSDTPQSRKKGWLRMALQILFLGPTRFSTSDLISRRLLCSPVIETFVLSKVPEAAADFIDRVTGRWAFRRVIPAHFNAPVRATPKDLQQAYAFAYELVKRPPGPVAGSGGSWWEKLAPRSVPKPVKYPEEDMATLDFVNGFILKAGFAQK